jgi:hypothetical protein
MKSHFLASAKFLPMAKNLFHKICGQIGEFSKSRSFIVVSRQIRYQIAQILCIVVMKNLPLYVVGIYNIRRNFIQIVENPL